MNYKPGALSQQLVLLVRMWIKHFESFAFDHHELGMRYALLNEKTHSCEHSQVAWLVNCHLIHMFVKSVVCHNCRISWVRANLSERLRQVVGAHEIIHDAVKSNFV